MKILHAIHSANPAGGGPIEGVQQLGMLARQNGSTVEVATLDGPDAPFLKSFPLPVHALGPGFLSYGYSGRMTPWLRENAGRYDVVIVNGIWQYHSFACHSALKGSSTPYVVFTHGMLDPWFKRQYPFKHIKKWLYWPWAEYRVLADAGAVLFTCEEERLLARKSFWLYKANERVVSYGCAAPPGDAEMQREEFRTRFPETQHKRLVLFLGRIHPKKGCDLAIRAFASVLAGDPAWQLVIAGPDQSGWKEDLLKLAVQRGIADRITWTGMLRGDLKWGAIYCSEVFFLPSHQENFGIVVAEALACSVPALISDKVNIWREVQGDGAGLVAPDDVDGSSSLLEQWVRMPEAARLGMRYAARRSFDERFEIHRASRDLLATLHEVTGADSGEHHQLAKASS